MATETRGAALRAAVARADWRRIGLWAGGILLGLLVLATLAVAAAPVGWLKPRIESEIAERTGTRVTIGSVERAQAFSFAPTLVIRDVQVAQPDWAGSGDLLRLREARLTVPVARVLLGNFRPRDIALTGLRADLIRDAEGRENWSAAREGRNGGGGGPPDLGDVRIEDVVVRYRDAKSEREALVRVVFDANGLRVAGSGVVRGVPVRIAARGAAIDGAGTWPFRAEIDGDGLAMTLDAQAAAPLDFGRFTGRMTARGNSLETIDAVIEAGLPGTQPVALSGRVERRDPDWVIEDLAGTIGRSRIAGALTVAKRDGRTKLTGNITSPGFDFDDLADAEGRARGAAKRARTGPRVVPDTDISIGDIDTTDGRIEFNLQRLLWRQPAPFESVRGVLTMDDRKLTITELQARLTRGRVFGTITVDARDRRVPLLGLDLRIENSTLATFAGHGSISGDLRGRVRLTGAGNTVRAAVGNANGMVGMFADDGVLPARMASFIGLDIGRGATVDEAQQANLRCLAFRMNLRGGTGTLAPLVVDTSRSQARVTGTINMKTEALDWSLTGAPKENSLLRYDRPLPIGGTIKAPSAFPPKGARSVGTVLRLFGKAITGQQQPLATDANCGALEAQALR